MPFFVSLSPPRHPSHMPLAVCVAGCPVQVSLLLARWYTIPGGLGALRARSGYPSGARRLPIVCSCARAPSASFVPPTMCSPFATFTSQASNSLSGASVVIAQPVLG